MGIFVEASFVASFVAFIRSVGYSSLVSKYLPEYLHTTLYWGYLSKKDIAPWMGSASRIAVVVLGTANRTSQPSGPPTARRAASSALTTFSILPFHRLPPPSTPTLPARAGFRGLISSSARAAAASASVSSSCRAMRSPTCAAPIDASHVRSTTE